jgi:hypothetical protein
MEKKALGHERVSSTSALFDSSQLWRVPNTTAINAAASRYGAGSIMRTSGILRMLSGLENDQPSEVIMKSSRTLDNHNKSNTRTETHLKTAGGSAGKARKSASEAVTQRQAESHDAAMRTRKHTGRH